VKLVSNSALIYLVASKLPVHKAATSAVTHASNVNKVVFSATNAKIKLVVANADKVLN
jgi:hypothetical protein